MTGSKELVTKLRPNDHQAIVTYGDKSRSKVTGFGKVVVTPNITLVNVMLVETLGYNLFPVVHLGRWAFPSSLRLKKRYCLVIVNDFSRYTWVYFFKCKSETQQVVIDFSN